MDGQTKKSPILIGLGALLLGLSLVLFIVGTARSAYATCELGDTSCAAPTRPSPTIPPTSPPVAPQTAPPVGPTTPPGGPTRQSTSRPSGTTPQSPLPPSPSNPPPGAVAQLPTANIAYHSATVNCVTGKAVVTFTNSGNADGAVIVTIAGVSTAVNVPAGQSASALVDLGPGQEGTSVHVSAAWNGGQWSGPLTVHCTANNRSCPVRRVTTTPTSSNSFPWWALLAIGLIGVVAQAGWILRRENRGAHLRGVPSK